MERENEMEAIESKIGKALENDPNKHFLKEFFAQDPNSLMTQYMQSYQDTLWKRHKTSIPNRIIAIRNARDELQQMLTEILSMEQDAVDLYRKYKKS